MPAPLVGATRRVARGCQTKRTSRRLVPTNARNSMPHSHHQKHKRQQEAQALHAAIQSNTPVGHIASGFAIPAINGLLQLRGQFNAQPWYETAGGGYYVIWSSGDNKWVITNAVPGQSSPFFYWKNGPDLTGN